MSDCERLVALNPFPGLRPFGTGEADRFFGRGKQIADLQARLRETSFLAVVGASGCGKSSLVCAGLLDRITAHGGDERTRWAPVVMRPGASPIAALARALAPTCGGTSASEELRLGSLYGRLRMGGLGLVEAVRLARLPEATRILVVVDQFEEVFRFHKLMDPDEPPAFVKLLLNAAADPDAALSVVITMRAERIGDCAAFRDLPETVNRGQYLVPKLTTAQRAETITGPVRLRGFEVAPRLVQRVLNDVSDGFDDLPIMQHALTRTWDRWAAQGGGGPLDLEHYEAIGTARQALAKHAEEVLASLGTLAPVVERTFRAITERSADGVEGRRPMRLDRLRAVVGANPGEVERVVEHLREPGTAFLAPADESGVVDITHEALIRQWPRLVAWSRAEAESREVLRRVLEAAGQFERQQGSPWTGKTLQRALEWWETARPTPAWVGLQVDGGDGERAWRLAEDFLDESAAAERKERRRQSTSRLLRVVVALSVAAAVAVSLGFWLVTSLWRSRELASKALLELKRDPALAAQLAVRSMNMRRDANAEQILRQALATLEMAHLERIAELGGPIADAKPSGDGTLVAVAAGDRVSILELSTLTSRGTYAFSARASWVWWIDADRRLLVLDEQGVGHDVRIGAVGEEARDVPLRCPRRSDGQPGMAYTAAVSARQELVALACQDGAIQVFRADAPESPAHEYPAPRIPVTVTALAFSNAGDFLVSGDADGAIRVWRLGAGTAPRMVPRPGAHAEWRFRHAGAVRSVSFHPRDPAQLLTSGDDGRAIVWHVDPSRRPAADPKGEERGAYGRPVVLARFAPREGAADQLFLVVDKRLVLSKASGDRPRSERGHDSWILDASASRSGELFVTGSEDGTARLWYGTGGSPIVVFRGHRGGVKRAFFDQGDARVVTASADGSVRVWRFTVPRVLDATRGWTLGIALQRPGASTPSLAIGDERGLRVVPLPPSARRWWEGGPGAGSLGSGGAHPAVLQLPAGFDQVSGLSWSADGRIMGNASTSALHTVSQRPLLWDAKSAQELTPEWIKGWLSAAFSSDGGELAASGASGTTVWPASALGAGTGAPRPLAAVEEGKPHLTAALSRDRRWVAALGLDNELRLWDRSAPGWRGRLLSGHEGAITALAFRPDSKVLLTASMDGTARLWPVEGGPEKVLQAGQEGGLTCAAFDAAGRRVVTGGSDGKINVWNADQAALVGTLEWHGGEAVNAIDFGADDEVILSAGDDGTVKLGRCDVCGLSSDQLEARATELARLDAGGKQRLDEASKIKLRDELRSWLSGAFAL